MKKIKLGQLEINLQELTDFIVEAKRQGYAADGEKKDGLMGQKPSHFIKGIFIIETIMPALIRHRVMK